MELLLGERPVSTPSRSDTEFTDRAASRAMDMDNITVTSRVTGEEATPAVA